MDGSMWLHHPTIAKIMEILSDLNQIGPLHFIYSSSTFLAASEFVDSDIRVKPEMDGLGALGDLDSMMELKLVGTNGSVHLMDFIIPFQEHASFNHSLECEV